MARMPGPRTWPFCWSSSASTSSCSPRRWTPGRRPAACGTSGLCLQAGGSPDVNLLGNAILIRCLYPLFATGFTLHSIAMDYYHSDVIPLV